MQQVILLGRAAARRGRRSICASRCAGSRSCIAMPSCSNELRTLEAFIRRELNVKEVGYDQAEDNYIRLYAKPNFPVLGKRLGKRMKEFGARIQQLTREQIEALQETGSITIDGEMFGTDEIQILREAKAGNERGVESIHLDRPRLHARRRPDRRGHRARSGQPHSAQPQGDESERVRIGSRSSTAARIRWSAAIGRYCGLRRGRNARDAIGSG